ncbi:unnamed protein product, partial [Ectocarpus sp. 12 AP-2014]
RHRPRLRAHDPLPARARAPSCNLPCPRRPRLPAEPALSFLRGGLPFGVCPPPLLGAAEPGDDAFAVVVTAGVPVPARVALPIFVSTYVFFPELRALRLRHRGRRRELP